MEDYLLSRRKVRVLTIEHRFRREGLALDPEFSRTRRRAIRTLDDVAAVRGYPLRLGFDNGPENCAGAMLQWSIDHNVHLHFIDLGKTSAERLDRIIQRSRPRRVPEHAGFLGRRRRFAKPPTSGSLITTKFVVVRGKCAEWCFSPVLPRLDAIPSEPRAMARKRKDRMESLNLTREQRAAFADLLGKKDVVGLRSMLALVYAAIQAQFDDHIGAEPYERGKHRNDRRNGVRTRGLNTRAGGVDHEIARARESNVRPTVSDHFKRSERALISVIQEAFVGGISTRKMEDVLAAVGVERLPKSQLSELYTELDARAEEFRNWRLTEKYPYMWLNALYETVRIEDHVVSIAVIIAYGVTAIGFCDVIAIDVVDTESEESWAGLLRGLGKRGLSGTNLVISDSHKDLKSAIGTVMQGPKYVSLYDHSGYNVIEPFW